MTTHTERDERMVQLAREGWTLVRIGAEYGVTRERVRQILNENGARTLRHDDLLERAAADWRASGQIRHAEEVLREHRLAANSRNIAILRRAVPELCLPHTRDGGGQKWTEEAVVAAIRTVATRHGIDMATGWMRLKDYTRLRSPEEPSTATIGANFLWSDLVIKAGFDPRNAPTRGRRGGVRPRQISDEAIDAAVLDYINSSESKSAAGFEAFLRERREHPSLSTILNRFRPRGITTIAGVISDVQARHS